jgi:hypothetical protein
MSDFKETPRLLTTEESRKLIRRFGDPHEQEHSMAERFAIADALEAANKRIAELEAILRQIGSEELRFTNRGYHIARDYFAAQEKP